MPLLGFISHALARFQGRIVFPVMSRHGRKRYKQEDLIRSAHQSTGGARMGAGATEAASCTDGKSYLITRTSSEPAKPEPSSVNPVRVSVVEGSERRSLSSVRSNLATK